MKVTFISLGCAKNLVDSEFIIGLLKQDNIQIIDDIEESDAIFVNTCGFIDSAKKEAIDTIFEVINTKKESSLLIVVGCLAKRYKEQLYKEIPEIDLIIGVNEYDTIGDKLNVLFHTHLPKSYNPLQRSLSNPLPVAYLKIGEGCSNRCAFCAIPLIRGDYYSYKKEIIIDDAKRLISLGKKEIVVIAQDPTRYGKDLYDDYFIEDLMTDLVQLDRTVYFRVLYLYPDRITDRLIEVFKRNCNLLPYFDIPIQHSSDHVLALMSRSGTHQIYLNSISKIKKEIPNSILRTTVLVGFPQETDEDFENLKNFIKEIKFDKLGAFVFSSEEGTKADKMEGKISKKVGNARKKEIMQLQQNISLELNKKHIGEIQQVLIEDFDGKKYYGRSYMFAPDDIDGSFIVNSKKELIIGEYYKVKVTKAYVYDVEGEVL